MRAPQALTASPLYQPLPLSDPKSRPITRLRLFATACGLFATLVGALVMVGWWTGVRQLTLVRSDWPAMMGSTALMLILSGTSLVVLSHPNDRWRKRLGIAMALFVMLIATLALMEWTLDWNPHLDRLLVHADRVRRRFPGRSSPQIALTFLLIGAALALLDRASLRWSRLRDLLCLVALSVPVLALLGYSYGVSHLYGVPPMLPYTGMAMHTAMSLVVLAIGIFAARPEIGLMGVLTSQHAGGIAARRTLVALLALPLVSWLIVIGVRTRLYPPEVGTALVVFAALLDSLLLLLTTSGHLERKDAALHEALAETAHWQQFFQNASWGAGIVTASGRLRFVNEAFARMHGFTVAELIGKPIIELFSPEYRDYTAMLPRLYEQGALRFESEHMRKDGSRFPVLIDLTAIKDESGRVLYRAGYMRDLTEERKAEQDRARLASLIESSNDGVIATTLDRTVLHWNPAAERIYGYTASEMIGRSVDITVPPARLAELEASRAAIIRGERFQTLETTRLRKDGSPIDVSLTISPIKNTASRVIGMSAIVRDISQRRAAEATLTRAHELERALYARLEQLSRASVAVSDAVADLPKTNLTTVLDTIASQAQALIEADYVALGIGTDQNKPFDTWVSQGMSEAQVRAIGRNPRPVGVLGAVSLEGEVVRIGNVREHQAFRGFPAQHPEMTAFLAVPIPYRGRSLGNLYLARGPGRAEFSAQDERLISLLAGRAGAAIETATLYVGEVHQRAWLQTIVDQMPEPVIVLDSDANISLQNRPAQALAHDAGAVDGGSDAPSHDIRYPSGAPVPRDALPHYRALHSGHSVLGAEFVIATRERQVPVVASATPVRIDSHIAGAVAIFQDVSALKELERQREEWISVVAHDLRQPISTISLAAEFLGSPGEPALPAGARESVQRIRKSVDKLGRMINDLLDASRLEASRLTIEREPVSLRALVEEATAAMPELAAIPLRLRFPEQPPWIWADRMRVDQILRNLLSNAVKYGAPGTPVELAVEPCQGSFEITVRNYGSGVSREDMTHLFQRFGRSEASKRAGIPGIGLGLYITQGLVQAHGGRIWAESVPGESTTFHVVLPALVQQAQASL